MPHASGRKYSATVAGNPGQQSRAFSIARQSPIRRSSLSGSATGPSGNFPPWKTLFRTVLTLRRISSIVDPPDAPRSFQVSRPFSKTCFLGGWLSRYAPHATTDTNTSGFAVATSRANRSQSAATRFSLPSRYPARFNAYSNRAKVPRNSTVSSLGMWNCSMIVSKAVPRSMYMYPISPDHARSSSGVWLLSGRITSRVSA